MTSLMEATAPLWANTNGPRFESLPQGDTAPQFDVAIVGAGITGLTAALLLKERGQRVVVLEARRVASGVTGGTTAHVTEVLDTRYHELERRFGLDGARLALESSREAIATIERLAEAVGVSPVFQRLPGYLFAATEEQRHELAKERDALERLGVRALPVDVPAPFSGQSALRFENQAALHPVRYVQALAERVNGDGSRVFEDGPVRHVEEGDPCVLTTASGATVKAHRVVLATHSALTATFLQTKVAAYRSYVVSGPWDRALPGLVWDLADPYHYVRTAVIDGTQHWIIGGEDHKTGQEDDTRAPFERLSGYARALGLPAITRCWSAQVLEPIDGLPYIGASRTDSRLLVASGFSGNGMTFGTIAARLLADLCTGEENPYAALYDAKRLVKATLLPAYATENIDFPVEFAKGILSRATARGVDALRNEEGEVVRVSGKSLAVYRDSSGRLHALSPICTHLGCTVAFNTAEKTWDCPCHGSRFAVDGSVIDGPATKPLAYAELPKTSNEPDERQER